MFDLVSKKYIYLGNFDVISKEIVISDPSYELDKKIYNNEIWKLNALITNAANGSLKIYALFCIQNCETIL